MSSINEKKILESAFDTLQKQTGLFKESSSRVEKQNQWADYKLTLRPEKENQSINYPVSLLRGSLLIDFLFQDGV